MPKYVVHGTAGVALSASGTIINGPICDSALGTTNNVAFRTKIRTAGTYSGLSARVVGNLRNTAVVFVLKKNGSNVTNTVTVPASTAGTFTDTTHTDSFSAGDLAEISGSTTAGTGFFILDELSILLDVTGSYAKNLSGAVNGAMSISTASAVRYIAFAGDVGLQTTQSFAQLTCPTAGTLSNIHVYVSSNSRTVASTLKLRKNGATGSGTVTLTALTTGYFEDTTNSDSVVKGDEVCLMLTHGTGSQAFTCNAPGLLYTPSTDGFPFFWYYTGGVASTSTHYFMPFGSASAAKTTESDARHTSRLTGTWSGFAINVSTNASSVSTTVRTRKNGANGAQSVSVPASTAGFYQDTSNTDSITAGDTMNIQVTGHNATFGLRGISSYFVEGYPTILGTSSMTLGAVTASGAADLNITGIVDITLGDVTLSATGLLGSGIEGVANITLGDITSSGAAALNIAGTVNITLGAITSTATSVLYITGTASPALDAVTSTATGTISLSAVLNKTFDAVTSSGAAALNIAGQLSTTLGAITVVSTGVNLIKGVVAQTLGAIGLSSTSTILIKGTTNATLGAVTISSTANIGIKANTAITLGAVLAAGQGTLLTRGAANITLGAVTSSATGRINITSTASIFLDGISILAESKLRVTATASNTLDGVTASGAAGLHIAGQVSVTLDPITLDSTAELADNQPFRYGEKIVKKVYFGLNQIRLSIMGGP